MIALLAVPKLFTVAALLVPSVALPVDVNVVNAPVLPLIGELVIEVKPANVPPVNPIADPVTALFPKPTVPPNVVAPLLLPAPAVPPVIERSVGSPLVGELELKSQ